MLVWLKVVFSFDLIETRERAGPPAAKGQCDKPRAPD